MYLPTCTVCWYSYDPFLGDEDNAIEAGTDFETLDESFVCPHCGAAKDDFIGIPQIVHQIQNPTFPLILEEEHTPFYTVTENSVTVQVGTTENPHPNEDDHAILFVALLDEDGELIELKKGEELDEEGRMEFSLPDCDDFNVIARCSLHGLWKGMEKNSI